MTAFENQTPLTLTFCDASKAFDRVRIRGLIYKLEKKTNSPDCKKQIHCNIDEEKT
jgi:hypothetical protein